MSLGLRELNYVGTQAQSVDSVPWRVARKPSSKHSEICQDLVIIMSIKHSLERLLYVFMGLYCSVRNIHVTVKADDMYPIHHIMKSTKILQFVILFRYYVISQFSFKLPSIPSCLRQCISLAKVKSKTSSALIQHCNKCFDCFLLCM